MDDIRIKTVSLLAGSDIDAGKARKGASTKASGQLQENLCPISMDPFIYRIGRMDKRKGIGDGTGGTDVGQTLQLKVHKADAGDNKPHVVICSRHIVILETLVESAV